ncbi:MAG: amidohydrolase family protein, partial [Actinomycetia bacterium]|nr:amidohydrolase family protein [Actinomycetes bacterium]
MPDAVMKKVWAYFDAAGPLTGTEWPIMYRTTEDERLATLRSFGVRRFTALCYPHKPDMAQWLNTWNAQFTDEHPDCLRSATFYPEPSAATYVRDALDGGAQLFKVHVQVGNYDVHDPLLDEVWSMLSDSGTPVITHGGNGPAPGQFTGAARMRDLLRRFPHLTMVVAHMGMPEYGEFLDLATEFPRVYLDTTMAFTDFSEAFMPFPQRRLDDLEALGERVLFGSDFPNIPYAYEHAVESVLGLGLGEQWERGVLHDNAARLLG